MKDHKGLATIIFFVWSVGAILLVQQSWPLTCIYVACTLIVIRSVSHVLNTSTPKEKTLADNDDNGRYGTRVDTDDLRRERSCEHSTSIRDE